MTIDRIVGGEKSFAALRSDGSVIAWGSSMPDGVITLDVGSPVVRHPVDLVYSGSQYLDAYGVLFDDGTVQTFGHSGAGGGSLSSLNLNGSDGSLDVVSLKGGGDQFSALRSDGSVVSWGNSAPSDATPSVLSSGVAQLVRSNLALMDDGSFVVFNKDNVSHNTSPIPLIGLNNSLTDDQYVLAGVSGIGNSLSNTIIGTTSPDILEGFDGHDTLISADGTDLLSGGSGNDSLVGGGESDWLDGGPGADTLVGGDGNDHFLVDDDADVVVEQPGGGVFDHVEASVSHTLAANVESLTLDDAASSDVSGIGNELDNELVGNNFANTLSGLSGDDSLAGLGCLLYTSPSPRD